MIVVSWFPVGLVRVIVCLVGVFTVMARSSKSVQVRYPMSVMCSVPELLIVVLLWLEAVVSQSVVVIQVVVREVVAVRTCAKVAVVVLTCGVLVSEHVSDLCLGLPSWRCDLMVSVLVVFPMRQLDRLQRRKRCTVRRHLRLVFLELAQVALQSFKF